LTAQWSGGSIEHVSEELVRVRERLRALGAEPVERLSQQQLQASLLAVQELTAMTAAYGAALAAELSLRGATDADGEPVETTAWLGGQLRTDRGHARALLRRGERLARLPRLAAALAAGRLTVEHADAITALLTLLPPDAHPDAEQILLGAALRGGTPRDMTLLLAQIRHRIHPDTTTDAAIARDLAQGLRMTPFGDGSYAVRGTLSPVAGAAVLATLRPHADPHGPDDRRSPARRLADALVHVCETHHDDPHRQPRRPEVVVLVPLATLHGQPDAPAGVLAETHYPLDDPTARALACTGDVRRLLHTVPSGPTGPHAGGPLWAGWQAGLTGVLPPRLAGPSAPLDLGRRHRLANRDQWLAILARDGGCAYPGCTAPPSWCDLHHLLEWLADTGPTDLDALALLCRRHHLHLHRNRQRLTRHPDGTYHLHTPATLAA